VILILFKYIVLAFFPPSKLSCKDTISPPRSTLFFSPRVFTEREAILQEVAALRAELPEAVKEAAVEALARGAAAHHAGCLPAWKALVERLFQRGEIAGH
jgi:superfamily II RNA helicase